MASRRLFKRLSGAALLAFGVLFGVGAPAQASGGGWCTGDIVIIPRAQLAMDGSAPQSVTIPLSASIQPGEYEVRTKTWDEYEGREYDIELFEQYVVTFSDGQKVGPTRDLADLEDYAYTYDSHGTVTFSSTQTSITLSHVLAGGSASTPEAFQATCVALTAVDSPPTTTTSTTTTTAPPTTSTTTTIPSTSTTLPGSTTTTTLAGSTTTVPPAPTVPPTTTVPPTSTTAPGSTTTTTPRSTTTSIPAPITTPRLGGVDPDIELSLDCANQRVRVEVENRSDLSGEVDLVIVRSLTRIRVLLDGGVTDTFELDLPAGSEDGTVEVVAVGGGGLRSTMSIEVDCHAPAELEVDVQLVCVDGELLLTIANTGDTTGVADVFIEQQAFVGSFLIAPGTQEIVRLDVAGLDGLPLRVVSDGDDVLRTTIDLDCPSAAIVASVALACPSGEVQLLIENTGDSPGTVLPVLDGERGEPIEIGAGESIVVIRRVDVGVETEVAVVSVDGDYYVRELIAPWVCESASGGPDQHTCASGEGGLARWQQIDAADIPLPPCPDLEVRLVFDCVDDAIDVEVINHTLDSRILTVVIGGETVVTDLAVAAEGSVAERYGDALGSRVVVLETGSTNELVNVTGSCRNNGHSDAETAAGLLVVLLSLVTAVVTKFDPWLRF